MPFQAVAQFRLRNATADFGQKQLDHVALVGMGIGPGGKPASETGAKLLDRGHIQVRSIGRVLPGRRWCRTAVFAAISRAIRCGWVAPIY